MKKAPFPKPILARVKDNPLTLEPFGIAPEKHEEFRKSMLAAASVAVDAFPGRYEALTTLLSRTSPTDLLAVFNGYGMQAGLANNGGHAKILPDIEQHHGELLQAILLTLPVERWGGGVVTPAITHTLFEIMPTLSQAFFMQRLLDAEAIEHDKEAMAIRSLGQRVLMHTHSVRNWGYFGHVVDQCRQLYAGLDGAMTAHHGFSASDCIDVLAALVSLLEARQERHWGLLGKILREGRDAKQLLRAYFRHVPAAAGPNPMTDPPPGIGRDQLMGLIMGHFDLRLVDTATFVPADLAAVSGKTQDVAAAVLAAISFAPGDLIDARPEHLFLDNPVWDRPAIALDGRFFCPMPQIAFSHIHRLMDRLSSEGALQEALKARRAVYLEQELEAVFRKALPDAHIRAGVKWQIGDQQFETDLLVVLDRVVLIAEAKSHRLTPQGLRGAPDRVKRHVRDMVLHPSIQSERLEQVIGTARGGNEAAAAVLAGIGIDATKADRVIRLSVTLDDFSVLGASENDFKAVGWVPQDHALAPSLLIADLKCVAEILENPLLFIHYLSERAYLQKSLNLLGDELDFLGLYLSSGFNLDRLSGEGNTSVTPTGMSGPIDRYYEGREAGLAVPKPSAALSPYYRKIIERLATTRPPAWTLIGLHLLSSADPAEQKAVERNLVKLRRFVDRHYRDPAHASTISITPPETRKAPVLFHLFAETRREGYARTMPRLAADALDGGRHDACVVFARSTGNWGLAFESVLLVERKP